MGASIGRKKGSYAFVSSNTENTISQTAAAQVEPRRTIDALDNAVSGEGTKDLERCTNDIRRYGRVGDRRDAALLDRRCDQADRHRTASSCRGRSTIVVCCRGLCLFFVMLAMRRHWRGCQRSGLRRLSAIRQTHCTAEIEADKSNYESRDQSRILS